MDPGSDKKQTYSVSGDEEMSSGQIHAGRTALTIICLIAIIEITYYFLVFAFLPNNWTIRGQFGDMHGTLNTFFSGITLAAIIYTARMQHVELGLQRTASTKNSTEIEKTSRALEKAAAHLEENALNAQRTATLMTTTVLIRHYRDQLSKIDGFPYPEGDERANTIASLRSRESELISILERNFSNLVDRQ